MQPDLKGWSCGAGQLVATLVAMWMIVEPTTANQRAPSDASRPSEVIVIGMIHAPVAFLLESSYSPAHVRATLARFRPAMIGSEASPPWNAWGMSLTATWEIDHLVVPWAAAATRGFTTNVATALPRCASTKGLDQSWTRSDPWRLPMTGFRRQRVGRLRDLRLLIGLPCMLLRASV